ncbi:endoglucanase 24 [Tanacetum coccineum]
MEAALAASSISFRQSDPLYANKLLSTVTRGFGYADTYSGAYLQAGLKADEAGWGSNKSDHTENRSRLEASSWGSKGGQWD